MGRGVSEDLGDMSGDGLEHLGSLGFSKETGGEVVEGILPFHHDIGVHGWVKWDLVEASCHVCLGEYNVRCSVKVVSFSC